MCISAYIHKLYKINELYYYSIKRCFIINYRCVIVLFTNMINPYNIIYLKSFSLTLLCGPRTIFYTRPLFNVFKKYSFMVVWKKSS